MIVKVVKSNDALHSSARALSRAKLRDVLAKGQKGEKLPTQGNISRTSLVEAKRGWFRTCVLARTLGMSGSSNFDIDLHVSTMLD